MKYTSTITSKGTITIAAPLRKALGFKPGQKVSLSIDKNQKVVIDGGKSMKDFEATRARIVKKIPSHLKGLEGNALREAAAKAWVSGYSD